MTGIKEKSYLQTVDQPWIKKKKKEEEIQRENDNHEVCIYVCNSA